MPAVSLVVLLGGAPVGLVTAHSADEVFAGRHPAHAVLLTAAPQQRLGDRRSPSASAV